MSHAMTLLNDMTPHEVACLPISDLLVFEDQVDQFNKQVQQMRKLLHAAKESRFGELIRQHRAGENKPVGVVRVQQDGFTILHDLPKDPKWDQERLAELAAQIRADGKAPEDYMTIAYRVPESKWEAWPAHIKEAFAPARTLKTKKPTIRILKEE